MPKYYQPVNDATIVTTDVTTNNASTSKHGWLKKLSNSATDFLDGTGAFDTVKDSDLAFTDITTNNVSTSAHGLMVKLPNDASKMLNGVGAYTQTGWVIVTKASDESVTSSTTFQDDDELFFTAASSGIYEFESVIIYTGAGAGDIKVVWGEDATGRGSYGALGGFTAADAASPLSTQLTDLSGTIQFGAAATIRPARMVGAFTGNGGTFKLQWAQASSSVTATTVKAGSVLRYRRVL